MKDLLNRLLTIGIRCGILALFLLFWNISGTYSSDVTLSWDANTETDLAGYKVYYGTAPQSYGAPFILGKQTSFTVTGLGTGTFYFVVTAFDTSNNESGASNEVSKTVTGTTTGCDVNGDGSVNVVDLQVLVNTVLAGGQPSGCDINKDGNVNALDVQMLANVVLGVRTCP